MRGFDVIMDQVNSLSASQSSNTFSLGIGWICEVLTVKTEILVGKFVANVLKAKVGTYFFKL